MAERERTSPETSLYGLLTQVLSRLAETSDSEEKRRRYEQLRIEAQTTDAHQWVNQTRSKNDDERRNAAEKMKRQRYEKKTGATGLDEAKKMANDVREAGSDQARDVSNNLARNVDALQTPVAAEFVARYSALADVTGNDPDVLYQEIARAYQTFEWTRATKPQVEQMRSLLDRAQRHVRSLVDERDFRSRPAAAWEGLDDQIALYTHDQMDDVPETPSTPQEIQKKTLDEDLRRQQNRINTVTHRTPEQELKMLEDIQTELERGVGEGRYNDEDAGKYIDRINSRIRVADRRADEVRQSRDAANRARRGASVDIVEPTDRTKRQYIMEDLDTSGTLHRVASSVFAAEDSGNRMSEQDLKRTYEQLGDLLSPKSTTLEDELVAAHPDASEDRLVELKRQHEQRARELTRALAKQLPRDLGEGRYWVGEKGAKKIDEMREGIIRLSQSLSTDGLNGEAYLDLDEVFFDILKVADRDPRGSFREMFNLYKESDLEQFYEMLEQGLEKSGVSHEQVKRVVERYTGLRNLKESFHNFLFIGTTSDVEGLGKFASTFLAEDVDLMFENIEGVSLAFKTQEAVLQKMRADYGGFLPTHMIAKDADMRSYWEQEYRRLFDKEIAAMGMEMADWQKDIAHEFARGFGIVTLRHVEEFARGIPAREYASVYMQALVQNIDPIRHLVVKYDIGAPGIAIFYATMTGDHETALRMKNESWGKQQILAAFDKARNDPNRGKTLRNMENLLQISSRFGPDSKWGVHRGTEHWTAEQHAINGFAMRIADIKSTTFDEDHHKNEQIRIQKIEEVLREALDKTPLAIARNWVHDPSEEWRMRRYQILQGILAGEDGVVPNIRGVVLTDGRGKTVRVDFTSFYDLLMNDPAKEAAATRVDLRDGDKKITIENMHMNAADRKRVNEAWETMRMHVDRLEFDLDVLQQVALRRIREHVNGAVARGETPSAFTNAISEADFAVWEAALEREGVSPAERVKRRDQVRAYMRAIKEASTEERGHHQYTHELAERIVREEERRLISTIDVPYEDINYSRWGSNGLLRRLHDAKAQVAAGGGVMKYLTAHKGHADMDKFIKILEEDIHANIAAYDAGIAKKVVAQLLNGTLRFYGEKPLLSITGPFGDIAGFFVESSLAKHFYGRTATAWGPNDKYKVIHEAEHMGILDLEDQFNFGPGHAYSGHALMKEHNASIPWVLMEIGSYVVPVALAIIIWQAFQQGKDELSESGGGGGHRGGGGGHH